MMCYLHTPGWVLRWDSTCSFKYQAWITWCHWWSCTSDPQSLSSQVEHWFGVLPILSKWNYAGSRYYPQSYSSETGHQLSHIFFFRQSPSWYGSCKGQIYGQRHSQTVTVLPDPSKTTDGIELVLIPICTYCQLILFCSYITEPSWSSVPERFIKSSATAHSYQTGHSRSCRRTVSSTVAKNMVQGGLETK